MRTSGTDRSTSGIELLAPRGANGELPPFGQSGRVEIAGVAGSLRAASWARTLLRATAMVLPAHVGLTVWDGLGGVPLFNEDLEGGPTPPAVAAMRELVARSDGLLIVTPEYSQSIPGVLKNALDWASRPYGQSVLIGKPVAAVGTSPLPTGAASALADVKKVITLLGAEVVEAELAVAGVHARFDADGMISDPDLAAQMEGLLAKLAAHAAGRVRALADA
jgi:chromate reductase